VFELIRQLLVVKFLSAQLHPQFLYVIVLLFGSEAVGSAMSDTELARVYRVGGGFYGFGRGTPQTSLLVQRVPGYVAVPWRLHDLALAADIYRQVVA